MLKITALVDSDRTILQLEGKLVGPWVKELERCWRDTVSGQPVTISLEAVTFIDHEGKELLARMYESGAELAAAGCMTKAIVEAITQRFGNR